MNIVKLTILTFNVTNSILAFCGMPGTAADMEILHVAAKELSCDLQIHGVSSVEQAATVNCKEKPICVGYSRGCWNAVQYALQYPAAGVLLIAPHLGSQISPIIRLLLHIPVLGTILLCIAGPKRIKKMLQDTSYPCDASPAYLALENIYVQPFVLRFAMLSPVYSIAEAEALIKSLQVPVYALAGECDKALPTAKALSSCLKNLVIVPQAGHALPWTHGRECVKAINSNFIAGEPQ